MQRRYFLKTSAAAVLAVMAGRCQAPSKPPNVLFIAVDDLRPELGCYGKSTVHSPNIDKLAAESVMFTRSFCNIPVCGASRASLLTGIRPRIDKFVTYYTRIDEDAPEAVTLPKHFKDNGYYTMSLGKVMHHLDDAVESWSDTPWRPDYPNSIHVQENWRDYLTEENQQLEAADNDKAGWPYEWPEVEDDAYYDGKIAAKAVSELEKYALGDQPFFLAVGFLKPHLPFNAPKKYWDMYDREEIGEPQNYFVPQNAPDESIHNSGELRAYYGVPKTGPVSDDMAAKLIHGYYACVSYTDAQIGKIMQALEENGQAENTIVILWGDHGWNLGEHTLWCKHANYKTSLRAPIIVKAPGVKAKQIDSVTEFVDIYPSLAELAGLPIPEQCEGDSFVPLLKNPQADWKDAVYSRWNNGTTITTTDFAYSAWHEENGTRTGHMLYDHRSDPEENINVVDDPKYADKVEELSKRLAKAKI